MEIAKVKLKEHLLDSTQEDPSVFSTRQLAATLSITSNKNKTDPTRPFFGAL